MSHLILLVAKACNRLQTSALLIHRTLERNFYRLCKKSIKNDSQVSEDTIYENKQTHEECCVDDSFTELLESNQNAYEILQLIFIDIYNYLIRMHI